MPEDAAERVPGHSTLGRVRILLIAAVTVIAAAACTAGTAPNPTGSGGTPVTSISTTAKASAASTGTGAGSAVVTGSGSIGAGSAIPAADLAAIRRAIDAINATAGGSVMAQRAELDSLAAPDQLAKQRTCPAAHSTLKFQPAYDDLRRAPAGVAGGDTAASTADGSGPVSAPTSAPTASTTGPEGAGYLLPAFITIYTGDRITGTDLTTLRLWIVGGAARTGALCVS